MRRAAPVLCVLLVSAGSLAGCRNVRTPVDQVPHGFAWETVQGDLARAGHAHEVVPPDPRIAWRSSVGRGLRSEVLVHGGVVVVTGTNEVVSAFSALTGDRYWERKIRGSIAGGTLWRGDTLWTASEHLEAELLALTLSEGEDRWKRRVPPSPYPLLLSGPDLFVATETGPVLAVDAATGGERWTTRIPGGAASTPVRHGAALLVASRRDSIYALDAASGRITARASLPGTPSASPTLRDGTLILPTHRGQLVAVHPDSLHVLWIAELGGPVLAAPVVAPDGAVYALDSSAGVWRVAPGAAEAERIASLGGAARSSLTLVAGGLLVGRLDGTLVHLGFDGAEIWRRDLGSAIWAPVTPRDGAVFVPLMGGSLVKLE